MHRLAILGSHPIPYRVPLYRELAGRHDVATKVFYGDRYGVVPRQAWGKADFLWAGDLLSGYDSTFVRNWALRPSPFTFSGKLNFSLIPELRRFRPAAVLVMGYYGVYQLQAIAAAIVHKWPIIYTSDTNSLAEPRGMRRLAKRAIVKPLYRRLAAFLTTGTRNLEHYRSYGVPSSKCFPFPWAVDNPAFSRQRDTLLPHRNALRSRFAVPAHAVCIVTVCRLVPEKNVGMLIRALKHVSDAHLLIVGEGSDEAELRAEAARVGNHRVTFTGFLNQDKLGEAYVAADVMALASSYEPWGLVANEAMNFGLPLVLSDRVGAAPDLVRSGDTGWTFRAGDESDLVGVLRDAVSCVRGRANEMRLRILSHIEEFSYPRQAAAVVQALDAIVR